MIPLMVLFLLLPVSLPVWNLLPKLRFLQFPWRWLLAVESPMAVLFAAAVCPAGNRRNRRLVAAGLCAVFFVGSTAFAARNFFRDSLEDDDDLQTILTAHSTGVGFIGTDEYSPAAADNSMVTTGLPDACVTDNFDTEVGVTATTQENPVWQADQGSCLATAVARRRGPESMEVSMTAPRAGFLVLKLRSYPAWRISLNGKSPSNPGARADGLVVMPVDKGPVEVRVEWRTTPDVVVGRCVSGLALLGLVALGLVERKDRMTLRRRQEQVEPARGAADVGYS